MKYRMPFCQRKSFIISFSVLVGVTAVLVSAATVSSIPSENSNQTKNYDFQNAVIYQNSNQKTIDKTNTNNSYVINDDQENGKIIYQQNDQDSSQEDKKIPEDNASSEKETPSSSDESISKPIYTITFYASDHQTIIEQKNYLEGETIKAPSVPSFTTNMKTITENQGWENFDQKIATKNMDIYQKVSVYTYNMENNYVAASFTLCLLKMTLMLIGKKKKGMKLIQSSK